MSPFGATCVETILARLNNVKRTGTGWSARCPAHDDRENSLSIGEGEDGRVLLYCHAGCTVESVAAAIGITVADLFPGASGSRPRRRIVSTHRYLDESGVLLFEVVRYDPKGFACRRPDGQGGWRKLGDVRRVLYRLPELIEAIANGKTIYIVEGEKDADTLNRYAADHGLPIFATTNPGGAGKWKSEYAEVLRGAAVVVVADRDRPDPKTGHEPGREHARKIARSLRNVAPSVSIAEAQSGKDAFDHIAAGHTVDDFVPITLEDETASTNSGQCNATTDLEVSADDIDHLLDQSGVSDLDRNSPPAWVENAMRKLSDLLQGSDDLRRAMVREVAIQHLTTAGLRAPSKIVDAALRMPSEPKEDAQGAELLLSDPELWAEPVVGSELLSEISATFSAYVVLPDGAADAQALWVMHAHCFGACFFSPILGISSPEKRCGKTTDLEVCGGLVPRPLPASNITAAALFRTVEKHRPTLLIDEADTFLKDNEELRGIVNSGHTRNSAKVVRTVGDSHEPRIFSTWCPKIIALIGKLPPTIEDRSIQIRMHRRARAEKIQRLRRDRIHLLLEPLRRKAARWAADNLDALQLADPLMLEALHDRAQDNWRLMFAIADLAGGDWSARARRAAILLSGVEDEAEAAAGIQLLTDIRSIFAARMTDRLSSEDIINALERMEDRPWPEWNKGRPLSKTQLARLLRRYAVRPTTIRVGDETPKGYLLKTFEDAFARYLPFDPQQPQQSSNDAKTDPASNRNTTSSVADSESVETPRPDCVVADVAVQNPRKGEIDAEPLLPLDLKGPRTEFEI